MVSVAGFGKGGDTVDWIGMQQELVCCYSTLWMSPRMIHLRAIIILASYEGEQSSRRETRVHVYTSCSGSKGCNIEHMHCSKVE